MAEQREAPTQSPQRQLQRRPDGRLVVMSPLTRFDFPEEEVPERTTYQWCVETVFGKEATEMMGNREAMGWSPVPASRHPRYAGSRGLREKVIRRGGQVLMERPKEITDEVREEDLMNARGAVANQMRRLSLTGHRQAGKGVKTTYEIIPDEMPR